MNMHFTDILDIALQRQANDEPINAILADYPQQAAALAPLLNAAQALNVVQPVVMPEAEALQADRLQFLAQVEQTLPAPVPNGFLARFNQWTTHQFPWILSTNRRREPKRMNALILKAALVLTLLFGAAGGTAVLAQESLPDSPVYPIKLVLEDARLALNKDGTEETTLHFSFAEERAQEMVAMAAAGDVPDTAVQARLETHINEALNLAAQQPDETMFKLLTQAQNMVKTQLQNIANVEAGANEAAQKMLGEAAGFLNRAGQEIESGLQTPQIFRARYGNIPEGIVPQDAGPCNTGDCEPAGDANKFGQDPDNEGQNGPGTCDGEDCEPVGDQNQFGQNEDNEGQNGPGDGTCEGEDCNQYRYQYGLDDLPLEPPHYQYQNLTGNGDGECNNGDCVPGGNDVNHGDGNNGDGNNGDGNNGDGNNGDGNGDGNNGDGNNGDGNNGGSGGNGGGNGGG
ncbi:MAG: hypothetical protein H6667_09815 [Ardenticatenaceae bacterium]|nr:hypothetical protein [Ardenticatenaceae bacterium]